MPNKFKLLLPAAALAAVTMAAACAPRPVKPPIKHPVKPPVTTTAPPPTTTTAPKPSCPAVPVSPPGPDSAIPISSWGIDGTAYTTLVVGNVVYVGGVFHNAVSPSGTTAAHQNLVALCLANGQLLTSFVANFDDGPRGATGFEPGGVRALATDGTSLFVGGDFTTLDGLPVNRVVKLDPMTGARIAAFQPAAIPAVVYAMDYSAGKVYVGGDFSVGTPVVGKKGADFNATTGAFAGWNPDADARINTLKVSADGQSVFIGGSFVNVGGAAHDKIARTSAATGAPAAVTFGQTGGVHGQVGALVFAVTVDSDNVSAFAGTGPTEPHGSGGGNKAVGYAPDGTENWRDTFDGDVQAVDLVGGLLYIGFHDGYQGDTSLKLLALDKATGAVTSFKPAIVGGIVGVRAIATGANRLVAVGDFASVNGARLHAVAIFP